VQLEQDNRVKLMRSVFQTPIVQLNCNQSLGRLFQEPVNAWVDTKMMELGSVKLIRPFPPVYGNDLWTGIFLNSHEAITHI